MNIAQKNEKNPLDSKRFWLSNLSIVLTIIIAGTTALQQGLQEGWAITLTLISVATAILVQINNFIKDDVVDGEEK